MSVWAQQGYDVADIEARAACEEHEVLGKTYQVKIHTTGSANKLERVREQLLEAIRSGHEKKKADKEVESAGAEINAADGSSGRNAATQTEK